MAKVLHIVNGITVSNALKEVFNENQLKEENHILSVDNPLSVGPLFHFDTKKGAERRTLYFDSIYDKLGYTCLKEEVTTLTDFLKFRFFEYDKIIIWHGENTAEILLKALCCAKINHQLYCINVSKLNSDTCFAVLSVSECNVETLKSYIGKEVLLTKVEVELYQKIWAKTIQKKEQFRIYKNAEIKEVSEDYYDNFILAYATEKWQRAIKVIGAAMGDNTQLTAYIFVGSRIVALINSGKLIVKTSVLPLTDAYVALPS